MSFPVDRRYAAEHEWALLGTDGIVTTGTNTPPQFTIALAASASASRTNGYIVGNLKKTYTATGSFTYLLGTLNGYSPMSANIKMPIEGARAESEARAVPSAAAAEAAAEDTAGAAARGTFTRTPRWSPEEFV